MSVVAVTLNLDESVLDLLKKEADRRNTTLDQALSEIIRAQLPRIQPFDLGPMRPEFNINKLNRLIAEEDDERFFEKLARDTGVDLRR